MTHQNSNNSRLSLTRDLSFCLPLGLMIFFWLYSVERLEAQNFNINVQQPTIRFSNVNTVVSVPDGGTMSLGGIHRSAIGQRSFGVPLVGSTPGLGRLFANQSVGAAKSTSQASVKVHLISLREMEQNILAEANRKERDRRGEPLNGHPDIQRRADFINRNVGRR